MEPISYAIMVVNELKDEWYQAPKNIFAKNNEFDLASYQRWALDEITRELASHKFMHPIDILDNFKYKCGTIASKTTSEDVYFMMTVLQDMCITVFDVIRGAV